MSARGGLNVDDEERAVSPLTMCTHDFFRVSGGGAVGKTGDADADDTVSVQVDDNQYDGLMSGYHDGREDREDVTRAAGAVAVLFATPKSNNHQGTLDDHDVSSKEVGVMKDKNKEKATGELSPQQQHSNPWIEAKKALKKGKARGAVLGTTAASRANPQKLSLRPVDKSRQ